MGVGNDWPVGKNPCASTVFLVRNIHLESFVFIGACPFNRQVFSILLDKQPIVPVGDALNMTLGGVIAHKSALKGGKWMKVPQFDL